MNLIYLLAAEGIVQDARTGMYSTYNIFESLNSHSFPFVLSKFQIAFLFEKTDVPQEVEINLKIMNNEEDIFSKGIKLNFANKPRCKFMATLNGLPINNPGFLEITLSMGETHLGAYKIIINKIGKPKLETKEQCAKTS